MTDEYDDYINNLPNDPDDSDEPEPLEEIPLGATFVTCSVRLTSEQGAVIKSLIQNIYPHTFPHYCTKVGISGPNFYNTLNGERTCTLEFLNKLLSGIQYEAIVLNPEIHIRECQIGEIVPNVDSIIREDESQSDEMGDQDTPDSYS